MIESTQTPTRELNAVPVSVLTHHADTDGFRLFSHRITSSGLDLRKITKRKRNGQQRKTGDGSSLGKFYRVTKIE
jgi:hypothetical protein